MQFGGAIDEFGIPEWVKRQELVHAPLEIRYHLQYDLNDIVMLEESPGRDFIAAFLTMDPKASDQQMGKRTRELLSFAKSFDTILAETSI